MHYRLLLIAAVALTACRGPYVAAGSQSAPATASAAVSPNSHDHVAPVSSDPLPVNSITGDPAISSTILEQATWSIYFYDLGYHHGL